MMVKPLTLRLKSCEKNFIDNNYKNTFDYLKALLSNKRILTYYYY